MTTATERIHQMHAEGVYDVGEIVERLIVDGQRSRSLADWFRELAPVAVNQRLAMLTREAMSEARRGPVVRRRVVAEERETVVVRRKVWYEKRHPVILHTVLAASVGTGGGRKPWAELTVSDLDWRWQDAEGKRVAASLSQQQCEKLRASMQEYGVKKVGHLPSSVLGDVFEVPLD